MLYSKQIFLFSNIYIKRTKTKLSIFFNYVFRKQKEKRKLEIRKNNKSYLE